LEEERAGRGSLSVIGEQSRVVRDAEKISCVEVKESEGDTHVGLVRVRDLNKI